MKKILFYSALLLLSIPSVAQQNIYDRSLADVSNDIHEKFKVEIRYAEDVDPNAIIVNSALWRYSPSLEKTLDNIFKPLGLAWYHNIKDTVDVTKYLYYKRSEAEGKQHLDSLLTLYADAAAFNQRRTELTQCFLETLGINSNIKRPGLNPVFRNKRAMKGYTVENVAFESFPGVYVTGSLYRPIKSKGKLAAILCPHGHFPENRTSDNIDQQGRYRPDMQIRCAALAMMGAVVFDYDMYGWGDSRLQSAGDMNDTIVHYTGFSLAMQTWNSLRVVDFLASLKGVDTTRIGVTGASGGGTQTMLVTALDKRIAVSAPVVMVSSSFYGGCGCESGLPIHQCGRMQTNNAEIAALAAPRPMIVVSDGSDWTRSVPGTDFPYLQKVYGLYGKDSLVTNVHLPNDKHDYGFSKRDPVYHFFAERLGMNLKAITGTAGIDESFVTIEPARAQQVFNDAQPLPPGAIKGHENIVKAFKEFMSGN